MNVFFAHMPIELSIALDEEKRRICPIVIFRIIQEALSNIVQAQRERPAPPFPSAWTATPSGSSSEMTARAFGRGKSSPT